MARPRAFEYQKTLDRAVHLFWKKGFHASSMRDLVHHMKINRASIYSSFGDKESLFNKSLIDYSDNLIKETAAFLYQHVYVREGLYNLYSYWSKQSSQEINPCNCLLLNSALDMGNLPEESRSIIDEKAAELKQAIFRYLDYGLQQGQISPYKDWNNIAEFLIGFRQLLLSPVNKNKSEEEIDQLIQVGLSVLT